MLSAKTFRNAIAFCMALTVFSCHTGDEALPESFSKDPAIDQPVVASAVQIPAPECALIEGTIEWHLSTMALGEVKTLSIQTYEGAIYKWTTSNGNLQILGADNSNSVTVKAVGLGSCILSVTRDANGEGGTCGRSGEVKIVKSGGGGGGGTICQCPSQVIDDQLCVSGGHPHWRFSLNYASSGDEIYWYGSHIAILTGQGSTYVVAEPDGTGDFTLYCRVTRKCADGTTKTRTAYYSNAYGGQCERGRTGFLPSSVCSSPTLD